MSYLLTYAQADIQKFLNCWTFSECIFDAYTKGKSLRTVKEWACCIENHADGGWHYHMALNLSETRRWQPIKNYIFNRNKLSVNFATKNCGYVATYRYVCKGKRLTDVLHIPRHSEMSKILSPVTKKPIKKFQSNAKKRRFSATNTEKIPHPKPKKML